MMVATRDGESERAGSLLHLGERDALASLLPSHTWKLN